MQRNILRSERTVRNGVLNLVDSGGSNGKVEGEMRAELKETFHIRGKQQKYTNFDGPFKELVC
jgi:hypothetical protein